MELLFYADIRKKKITVLCRYKNKITKVQLNKIFELNFLSYPSGSFEYPQHMF